MYQVVCALKFLLRAGSPRDYLNILLSLKYKPSVDKAHMVAAHGNARSPSMFQPNEGKAAKATPTNIQVAKDHSMSVPMPWLDQTAV